MRLNLLKNIQQEFQKKSQKITDPIKSNNVNGEKIADDIFNSIVDSITLEELEKESI